MVWWGRGTFVVFIVTICFQLPSRGVSWDRGCERRFSHVFGSPAGFDSAAAVVWLLIQACADVTDVKYLPPKQRPTDPSRRSGWRRSRSLVLLGSLLHPRPSEQVSRQGSKVSLVTEWEETAGVTSIQTSHTSSCVSFICSLRDCRPTGKLIHPEQQRSLDPGHHVD